MSFDFDFDNVRAALNLLFQLFLLAETRFPNFRKWLIAFLAVAAGAVIGMEIADPVSLQQTLDFAWHVQNMQGVAAALDKTSDLVKTYRNYLTGKSANQGSKELPEEKEN
jgi:hypothetical protein